MMNKALVLGKPGAEVACEEVNGFEQCSMGPFCFFRRSKSRPESGLMEVKVDRRVMKNEDVQPVSSTQC